MTDQEARDSSEKKIMQIKDLAKSLQVRITAKQAITQGNIIEPIIYFIDEEQYPIDKPTPVAPGPLKTPPGVGMGGNVEKPTTDVENTDIPK